MHAACTKKPIPRLGGLAIYGGFLCSILIFGQLDETMLCVLLGAAIIVALGIFDDVLALGAKLKFVVQIVAAAIPVCIGDLQIGLFTNLNPLSDTPFVHLGILAVPATIIWIVGITNAVNLIDGLDGLAVGVSSIAAITMLAVALLTGNMPIAITMAALAGACIGFMPYNLNPAKIFMGDTGSTFLGYMLATVSIMGLFKFYAVISFAVPFLILGLPIFDYSQRHHPSCGGRQKSDESGPRPCASQADRHGLQPEAGGCYSVRYQRNARSYRRGAHLVRRG